MRNCRAAASCVLLALISAPLAVRAQAPAAEAVKLVEPAKKGGLSMMETLSVRASVRAWADRDLGAQDLSDLLWAANGINRPDRKRTAASAMNSQDVDVYVLTKTGAYVYDAANHALTLVQSGDHRAEVGVPAGPPVHLFLVSDGAKFRSGPPERKLEWGALDSGIVSANISLFCAARGLATVPRATFDAGKLKALLKLSDAQHAFLNHPVGYPADAPK